MGDRDPVSNGDADHRLSVLWATRTLSVGGVERLLTLVGERHDPVEFDVRCAYVVRTGGDLIERLEAAGVRCLPLGGRGWPFRLLGLVVRSRFDVVHAHSPALSAVTRIASRLRGRSRRPVHITTEHLPRNVYDWRTRIATALTSRFDDVVIAVSEGVKRSIRGVVSSRTVIRYQGIELDRFRIAGSKRTAGDDGVLRILCVANFRPQKAHEVLIRAVHSLDRSGLRCRLTLIGGTSSTAEEAHELLIRSLVNDANLGSKVEFLPPDADVATLMSTHDVLAISSHHESGPLVAMEAAAAGLPIVATNVGIMAEVFRDGESCLRVEPGDPESLARALRRLFDDRDLTEKIREGAYLLVDRFDIDRVARELFDLYRVEVGRRRLVGSRRPQ